jgi:hypothetical protein
MLAEATPWQEATELYTGRRAALRPVIAASSGDKETPPTPFVRRNRIGDSTRCSTARPRSP